MARAYRNPVRGAASQRRNILIVYWTTYRALERLAVVNPGAIVRPWIQAYAPLVKNADVVKQINAANDAGGMGAMCWNDYDIYPRLYP